MGCGPVKEGLKGVRAISLVDEAEMEVRATEEALRAGVRDDEGVTCCHGGDWRVSEAFSTVSRARLTDEALAVEASRGTSGLDETVVGVGYQTPLCAVLKDGSPWVMDSVKEKSKGNNMSGAVEVMQERVNLGNKWDESSLAKFSKVLGFSTKGVEGEILKLLLKLKTRRDQGKKKGTLGLTRGGAEPRGGEIFGGELWMPGNVEDGFKWTFSGVYGPTLRRYREVFWEELGAIRGLWNDPWCIGGDFNMIKFPNERRRGGRVSSSMRRFSEVIDELELRDSLFRGARLPGVEEEGFKELPVGWWQGLRFSGSFSFILAEKLKALKVISKSWNKDVFGKVGVNKKLALDKVDFWDN
ncbi:hypothetical protein CK203_091740 [Vitis vinifera]|uniref:DUF4283 domain-containing protein n=1 Tax=Vitis vinifera TaxID=29760 RepID=A0A438EJ74_VITVI|nr:hypothetical protein CK203_091740 [Vitis vinifera]